MQVFPVSKESVAELIRREQAVPVGISKLGFRSYSYAVMETQGVAKYAVIVTQGV